MRLHPVLTGFLLSTLILGGCKPPDEEVKATERNKAKVEDRKQHDRELAKIKRHYDDKVLKVFDDTKPGPSEKDVKAIAKITKTLDQLHEQRRLAMKRFEEDWKKVHPAD